MIRDIHRFVKESKEQERNANACDRGWRPAGNCVPHVFPKITEYAMVGGPNWWNYVVVWKSEDDDKPEVSIHNASGLERQSGTLIVRTGSGGHRSFRLVGLPVMLPNDTKDNSYSKFLCPI
jgi:hypothetical protein